MTTAAVGCITKAEEILQDTLAACEQFQALVNETTAAGAEAHIYVEAVPPDDVYSDRFELEAIKTKRPFARIWTKETSGLAVTRSASPYTVATTGTLYVWLEQNTPWDTHEDYAETDRLWKNRIGQIIRSSDAAKPGLVELSSTAGYLDWERIEVLDWWRTAKEDYPTLGDAQMCVLQIDWGTRA